MKAFGKLIPYAVKRGIRKGLANFVRPKMIWGYKLPNGQLLKHVRISNTACLYHPENIEFEDDIFVWHYSIIDGTGGVKIGEGTQVGAWVGIFTHSSHLAIRLLRENYRAVAEYCKPAYPISSVEIGEYVFIAAGSKILPGVKIGSYSLISTLSVVKSDVPPHSIVEGNPARIIGSTKEIDKKTIARLNQEQFALLSTEYLKILG